MTTEKDVYDIDTSGAQKGMEELADKTEHAEHAQHSLKEQVDELGQSFANKVVSLEFYIEALKELAEWGKETVKLALEQDQAMQRLEMSLKHVHGASNEVREALLRQAETIEKLTGASEEHTLTIQAMLAQMGVGAEDIEAMTDAAYRLAQMTGQDATTAARMLARANAEGKDELKRFAISVDDATFKAKGFKAVIEEVQRKTISLSESVDENTKRVNALNAEWETFEKTIGHVIVNSDLFKRKTDELASSLQLVTRLLKGQSIFGTGEGHETNFLYDLDYAAKATEIRTKQLMAVVDMINAHYGVKKEGEQKPRGIVELGEPVMPGFDEHAREKAESFAKAQRERFYKQQQKEAKDDNDIELAIMQQGLDDEARAKEAFFKQMAKENADDHAISQAEQDLDLKAAEAHAAYRLALAKKTKESMIEAARQEAEVIKSIRDDEIQTAKQYLNQLLSMTANFIGDMLLENTRYNRQLFELQVERETVGMSETQAMAKRAEMEGRIRDEKVASFEKELAASLMSVAKDAAVKALWEGAEAVAAFAGDRWDAAEEHAVAAGLFAGVAVAAGGAGYALNSTRGMTSDEHQRLEDAKRENADRDKREAQQASQRGEDTGAKVTVIYMGIAGVTELEQAKELARIQKEYDNLKTGGK